MIRKNRLSRSSADGVGSATLAMNRIPPKAVIAPARWLESPRASIDAALHEGTRGSAPAELRRDVLEDALERVRVVFDSELVRHRQQQRVGRRDGLVRRELLHERAGLGRVRAAEDRAGGGVDVTALLLLLAAAPPAVRALVLVVERGDTPARRH